MTTSIEQAAFHSLAADSNCRARRLVSLALFLLLALGAASRLAAAHNRLFNPDLDDNTLGWSDNSAGGIPAWDLRDRNSCVNSGSAILAGQGAPPLLFFASFAQCIPTAGDEILLLQVDTKVVFAFDAVQGQVHVDMTAGGCDEPALESAASMTYSAPFGVWTTMAVSVLVPPGADAARVIYQLWSPADFAALFDAAFAGSVDDTIFSDDFEIGEFCRWGNV